MFDEYKLIEICETLELNAKYMSYYTRVPFNSNEDIYNRAINFLGMLEISKTRLLDILKVV